MLNSLLETALRSNCTSCGGRSKFRQKKLQQLKLTERGVWVMGYRECSVSGCPCPAFQDTYGSDLCNNCGHKYTDHW